MTTAGHSQPTLDEAQVAQAKQRILELRAEGYSAAYCAGQAGIARRTLYHWLESPDYAQAWQDANECHHDWFEDRLRDRAAQGADVAIIVGLKMSGRFVEKGQAQDPEQLAQAIVGSLRQLAAEQRRLSQAQIAEPAQPDRALDISSIVRSDTPDSHSQQSS